MNRDVEFLYEVGCLRFIQRTWRQFLNPNYENLAEHTLRVIWIALMIAKYEEGVDQEKLVKMALVHDLVESRTGDTHHISRRYVSQDEERAMEDILEGVSIRDEFLELWHEYEVRESIESKIVKDADNIDVDFEIQEQAACGYKDLKEVYMPNRIKIQPDFHTESAKKMWKQIYDSSPHDWHKNAKHRFNTGDWMAKL